VRPNSHLPLLPRVLRSAPRRAWHRVPRVPASRNAGGSVRCGRALGGSLARAKRGCACRAVRGACRKGRGQLARQDAAHRSRHPPSAWVATPREQTSTRRRRLVCIVGAPYTCIGAWIDRQMCSPPMPCGACPTVQSMPSHDIDVHQRSASLPGSMPPSPFVFLLWSDESRHLHKKKTATQKRIL
jgi:hypothetical protein